MTYTTSIQAMQEKLSVNPEEINGIINQLTRIVGGTNKEPTESLLRPYPEEPFELNDIDKAVRDFIIKNPGTSKENLVRRLRTGSRGSIYKAMKRLLDYDLIHVRKDSRNTQLHHLYMNDSNVITSTLMEVEKFRLAFTQLVENVKKIYKVKQHDESNWKRFQNAIIHLLMIFRHFIGICFASAISIWTARIQDKAILNRLYALMFANVLEVQDKLSQVTSIKRNGILSSVTIDPLVLHRLFELDVHKLASLVRGLNEDGLIKAAEPVLDSLWKFTEPFIPAYMSMSLHRTEEPKSNEEKREYLLEYGNWRKLAQEWGT